MSRTEQDIAKIIKTLEASRNIDILNEHREIVNQIIAKDMKGAKNAMIKHLRGKFETNKHFLD